MIDRNKFFKKVLKICLFIPLIFYYGKKSYIAFDEGFYALQARWILEKGNWTIPLWWDEYVLDRTNGLQVLIAKSQEIFGKNLFAAYLPTTIAAILMLIITYKLHEEFFGKNHAIVSPLILSTTYLWFDYSHLATQDLIYSSLVTIGVFSLVKIKKHKSNFYILLFGTWIGLAFMMKTFLVAVPLAALTPYILSKRKLLFNTFFWLGLLIGFIPYLIWTYSINTYLDQNIIFYLFGKFNFLSNKNDSTNPFYYYLWNIPITFLPWSIFSIIGLSSNTLENKNGNEKLILIYFPLILILILSIFSTKTPYYPLQISSILSLNSYIGIKYLFSSKRYKSIVIFITSRLIPLFISALVVTYIIFFKSVLNLTIKENIFIILGLISFSIAWSYIKDTSNLKKIFTTLIIGPYLLTALLLQSGLFTDRSRELRETMEYLSSLDILKNQVIKVDKRNIGNEIAQSKIIRISLLTPNLGDGIENLEKMNPSDLAWSNLSSKELSETDSFQIIYDYEILSPWKLIRKNR
ncbi:Dolichyl-phosphate-mannose-proteinmannosyltransferase [Prochlorococcus marinus str. MIT 9515]|uniref:Dolichyl-phosphate-mannose-proteinmannosyltransferase n=1 Tax=Prochlorococcus marinus (strain MIT 9515) TaxID=167542 RepID=A2BYM2_PROM5|nr:glycosyltransferase family 39 protein [Prochlorococcus marinus]ABM72883.1 Dolichyl-phosphate-mannose-proteinmannosyltransferase [Prochlorococcus marinus str. MIT 9515]